MNYCGIDYPPHNKLNQMHIPSRVGEWGQTSIANIINNEVYLGKIRWRKEPVKRVVKDGMLAKKRVQNDDYELYDGRHEAIITEEQWTCAKAAQAKRNHPPTHKERHLQNPLHHIRNAFAHGRFSVKRINKEYYIYLEDVTEIRGIKGLFVDARICLKKTTLIEWLDIFEKKNDTAKQMASLFADTDD